MKKKHLSLEKKLVLDKQTVTPLSSGNDKVKGGISGFRTCLLEETLPCGTNVCYSWPGPVDTCTQ